MNNVTSKNNFIANVLVILSLLGLFLFTNGAYTEMQEMKEVKKNLTQKKEQTEVTLKKFRNIQDNIEKSENLELKKYDRQFKDSEAVEFVFDMVKDSAIEGLVTKIDVSEADINKFGFMEAQLEIGAQINDVNKIMTLIDNINKNEKYKMFIDAFELPRNDEEEGLDETKLSYVVYFK